MFGGILLAAGGAGVALWPSRRRHMLERGLRVFDARDADIFTAIAISILAIEPGAASPDSVDVARRADNVLALEHPADQRDFLNFLRLVENGWGGILTGTGLSPFTRTSRSSRERRLRALSTSRFVIFRSGYQALRRLAGATYYSAPETWLSIGYPGPPTILPS